jgi:hypothetical protein
MGTDKAMTGLGPRSSLGRVAQGRVRWPNDHRSRPALSWQALPLPVCLLLRADLLACVPGRSVDYTGNWLAPVRLISWQPRPGRSGIGAALVSSLFTSCRLDRRGDSYRRTRNDATARTPARRLLCATPAVGRGRTASQRARLCRTGWPSQILRPFSPAVQAGGQIRALPPTSPNVSVRRLRLERSLMLLSVLDTLEGINYTEDGLRQAARNAESPAFAQAMAGRE